MGGSNKAATVGYKYYLGLHMVFCHGPVDRCTHIRVDGRVAWTGSSTGGRINVTAESLFGGEKREGGVSGAVDFETGEPDQPRNDYLTTHLGANVPAFRGVCGFVLRQVYVGLNPYLKKWSARLQRIYTRQGGIPQWYPDYAGIPLQVPGNDDDIPFESEDFSDGGSGFNTNDASGYEIVGGALRNTTALSFSGSYYERPLAVRSALRRLEFDLTMISDGGADPAILAIVGEDGTDWFLFNPQRDSDVDPEQRPSLTTVGGSGVFDPVGGSKLSLATEYSVSIDFDLGLNLATIEIRVKSSGSLFASETREINSFALPSKLKFIRDGDVTTKPVASYDNIKMYPYMTMDMNPVHILRECLTDPDWGMGYQESDIDSDSFESAARTLFNEGMGISIVWDRQTKIEDFLKEILRHINASIYVSRSTGKFVIKLIRADYDEETLLVLDESNIESVDAYQRPAFGELVNAVTVNFWDSRYGKTSSVSLADTALVQLQGSVNGTTLQFPGFTSHNIAARVCERSLRTISSQLLTATLTCNREASDLNIGSVFKFEWPELHEGYIVMRVTSLSLGDGRKNTVKISCVEDLFSLPQVQMVGTPEDGWVNPSQPPSAIEPGGQILVEAPYYELVQRLGQSNTDNQLSINNQAGMFLSTGIRPNFAINATLSVDSGAGYEDTTVTDFCPSATLLDDVGHLDTVFNIGSVNDIESIVVGNHAQIGDELVRIDSISSGVMTVGRGVLDTVPAPHLSGSTIFVWDLYAESDGVEYVSGESVDVKLLPVSGAGSVLNEDAIASTLTFNQRAFRPYAPGNFKIDGENYPSEIVRSASTTISWVYRDRLQQTSGLLVDTLDAGIGPEAGTSHNVQLRDGTTDVILDQTLAIFGTSASFDTTGYSSTSLRVRVWSSRGGVESYQKHDYLVDFVDPPWTPGQISTLLWLDASDPSTITLSSGISQWADKSGNARHMASPIGNRPAVQAAELNGLNVVRFDGVDDYMSRLAGFFSLGSVACYVVCRYRSSPATTEFVLSARNSGAGTSKRFYLSRSDSGTGSVFNFATGTTAVVSDGGAGDQAWRIFSASVISGTQKLGVDGTDKDSDAQAATDTPDYIGLGGLINNLGVPTTTFTDVDIAEIVFVNNLTNEDKIEGYLAWKWGLQAQLDPAHPYYSARPTV